MKPQSKKKKAYVATFGTETNSFIEFPTLMADFEDCCLYRRGNYSDPPNYLSALQIRLATLLEGQGFDVFHGLCAFGKVSGPVDDDTYNTLTKEIFDEVKESRPDIILMFVHGAMISSTYADAEGEFLANLRKLAGPDVFIGCVLDLHVNLSNRMLNAANLLIGCKEYPHDDFADAAEALVELARRTLAGEINPTTRYFDCRLIGLFGTKSEPMKSHVDGFRAIERSGSALQVWAAHGFPWADSHDTSYKVVVTTDNDPDQALRIARQLGQGIYDDRKRLPMETVELNEIHSVKRNKKKGPLVLGDIADNPMGGAPGDSTYLLRHLIEKSVERSAFATILDPELVAELKTHSVGASVDMSLGGKISKNSGPPIVGAAEIRGHFPDMGIKTASGLSRLGDCVLIRQGPVDIIVASIPAQIFSPAYFTDFGLELSDYEYVGVKSTQHFASFFAETAGGIAYVSTPGALAQDYSRLAYDKLDAASIWPVMPDPLSALKKHPHLMKD